MSAIQKQRIMGTRVYFSKGSRDGALGYFLSAPLDEFQDWFVDQYFEPEVVSVEPEQILILDDILQRGAPAFVPESAEEAHYIDLIFDAFYYWCEWEKKYPLIEASSSYWKVWRYYDAEDNIKRYFGEFAAQLWNYLLRGRPVGRKDEPFPYTPRELPYVKSYWSYEEVGFWYYRLSPHKDDFARMFDRESSFALEDTLHAVETAFHAGVGLIIEVS